MQSIAFKDYRQINIFAMKTILFPNNTVYHANIPGIIENRNKLDVSELPQDAFV